MPKSSNWIDRIGNYISMQLWGSYLDYNQTAELINCLLKNIRPATAVDSRESRLIGKLYQVVANDKKCNGPPFCDPPNAYCGPCFEKV